MADNVLGTKTLQYPVKFGNDTVTEVTLKRPNGYAMKAMGKGENTEDKMMILIAECAGLPVKIVYSMDYADITALSELAGGVMGESQATGATS